MSPTFLAFAGGFSTAFVGFDERAANKTGLERLQSLEEALAFLAKIGAGEIFHYPTIYLTCQKYG
jgi:hypothetical protein